MDATTATNPYPISAPVVTTDHRVKQNTCSLSKWLGRLLFHLRPDHPSYPTSAHTLSLKSFCVAPNRIARVSTRKDTFDQMVYRQYVRVLFPSTLQMYVCSPCLPDDFLSTGEARKQFVIVFSSVSLSPNIAYRFAPHAPKSPRKKKVRTKCEKKTDVKRGSGP